MNLHWRGDIFQLPGAEVVENQTGPAFGVVPKSVRSDHAARFGVGFEPRRDVDAFAEKVVAFDNHVADMQPDPQLQR